MSYLKEAIHHPQIIEMARKQPNYFIRNRVLGVKDWLLYLLNKKGLSTKIERDEFIEICEISNVSSVALLKQREKLNPDVFKPLNASIIGDFYTQFSTEVKTFKGHVILGIDGSEWEVPNNRHARAYIQRLLSCLKWPEQKERMI